MTDVKNGNRIKIFIVDDHEIVRCGLTQYLNSQKNLVVCGEADNANTAISLLNSCMPQIAIIDINLGDINGIELIKAISKRYNKVKMLVHSMHHEKENIRRALQAGANGYILKSEPAEQIIKAIESIIDGGTYLSISIKNNIFDILIDPGKNKNTPSELTDREFEIFKLIGMGCNRKEIAGKQNLTPSTIGTYRDRIKSKLKVNNSNELVKYAVEWFIDNKDH